MSMIDYNQLLATRFDLVLRYHILDRCDFNFNKAHKALHKGEFWFLEDKLIELRNQFRESLYLFRVKNWAFVDEAIGSDEDWIRQNPLVLTADGVAVNVKRFVVSLRRKKPLFWAVTGTHPKEKVDVRRKIIWKRETYRHELSSAQFKAFERTEASMLAMMHELKYFTEPCLMKDVSCPVTEKQTAALEAVPKMARWNEFKMWEFWRDVWLRFWLKDFKGSVADRVLDFGCGSCWASFVGKSVGYKNIVNLDIDDTEVRECFSRYTKILNQKVKLWNGKKLPFKDNRFDSVVARASLLKLVNTSLDVQISELCRVTKPCGSWYVSFLPDTVEKFVHRLYNEGLYEFLKSKNISLEFFSHLPVPKRGK